MSQGLSFDATNLASIPSGTMSVARSSSRESHATSMLASNLSEGSFVQGLFFARCCLGKVPGGAPFSQLHKSDKQSGVDKP